MENYQSFQETFLIQKGTCCKGGSSLYVSLYIGVEYVCNNFVSIIVIPKYTSRKWNPSEKIRNVHRRMDGKI